MPNSRYFSHAVSQRKLPRADQGVQFGDSGQGFADTLTGDVVRLEIALEGELWLKNDLQALIDTESYVHIIDLKSPVGLYNMMSTTMASLVGSQSESQENRHHQWVGSILNGLRSVVLAISDGENIDDVELVKSCDRGK